MPQAAQPGVPKAKAAAADGATPSTVKELETRLALETTLRRLTNKIHCASIDEMLLSVRNDVQRLIGCERVTIYAKDPAKPEIISKVKDGNEVREIRLPMGGKSIASWVARTQRAVRIRDAYDSKELTTTHADLAFDSTWDTKSGFRTRQVLGAPIAQNGKLLGVIQAVNKRDGAGFTEDDERIVSELSETLAIAMFNQRQLAARRTRYDRLLMAGRVTDEMIEEAKTLARQQDASFEKVLMDKFKIPKAEILQSLAEYYRCDAMEPAEGIPPPMDVLEDFVIDYLKHHVVCPLGRQEESVVVFMGDPKDVVVLDDLKARLSCKRITPKVGIREDVLAQIDFFLGEKKPDARAEETAPQVITEKDLAATLSEIEREIAETATEASPEKDEEVKDDDKGIVRLVNQVVEQACARGASDIHVEPYPTQDLVVRFRVDGVCQEYTKLPKKFARAVVSRIKIMSGLDIAERRLPQDGKIKFRNYGRLDIELRVAVLPTAAQQEDVVMRILAASKPIPIENIGMTPANLENFKKIVEAPYGILLVVGPTGSGKTTTLHSAMGFINTPDMKIWTAEDPVEITQYGLRQVQIHHKIGYTFERALRSFLRADPDVIMVGEMRDFETASAGIEASLTGHLVFSTLHTNNAPETITRLLDMGLDPYSFGDSLLGVLAQRLVRTLCKECKKPYRPDEAELKNLEEEFDAPDCWKKLGVPERDKVELMKADGCERCRNSGYKGRMGIHELMAIDDELRGLIYKKSKGSEIRDMATKKGMLTLKQDGLWKVVRGFTDMREIRAVASR